MKISLPVHHYLPNHAAGAELYTHRLAQWLHQHGHDVEVITFESISEGMPNTLDVQADELDGVRVWRLRTDRIHSPTRRRDDYHDAALQAWMTQHYQNSKPDLVHAHSGYLLGAAPVLAAQAAGVPSVLSLHDYFFLCPRHTFQRSDNTLCETVPADPAECAWCYLYPSSSKAVQFANRFVGGGIAKLAKRVVSDENRNIMIDRREQLAHALQAPAALIAPSRYVIKRFAPFVNESRFTLIRYGIDVARFDVVRNRSSQAAQTPSDPFRIGFIGQVAQHKGVHVLVQAFKLLHAQNKKIELHIHGSLEGNPQYVQHLQQLAAGDPRIVLHGKFSNTHAPEIVSTFHVTVVPSVWYETGPMVTMESYAAGVPVITSTLGNMPELVHDGVDGLHFEGGNAQDLASKLQRLVDDPTLLNTLRQNAPNNLPMTTDTHAQEVMRLYERILND